MIVDDPNQMDAGGGRSPRQCALGDVAGRRSARCRRTRTRSARRRRRSPPARFLREAPIGGGHSSRCAAVTRCAVARADPRSRNSAAPAAIRRGMPACRNSFSMSDDQNSNTSNRASAGYGGHCGWPVTGSIATARCSWLTRIGDLPGMYQVSTVRGQCDVRKIAAVGAHSDLRDAGWRRQRRHGFVRPREIERVRDAEEQRRRCIHADERRIASPLEVADPDHQHVRANDAGRPGVAKAP